MDLAKRNVKVSGAHIQQWRLRNDRESDSLQYLFHNDRLFSHLFSNVIG